MRTLPRFSLLAAICAALVVGALGVKVALAIFADVASVPANTYSTDTLNPPTSLAATGGCRIDLSWTATPDSYASGHRVLRGTATGGPYTQIAEVAPRTTTTYVDSPPAGTYYYAARAFFQNWESANGNETSASVTSSGGICLDAASSCTPTSASSFTWSHTTSGTNRILIVGVAIRYDSSQTVTGMTYAGTAMTLVDVQNNGSSVRVELWRLVAPATGANNVVVTVSSPAKTSCGAVSFTGVDQTTPIDASAFAASAWGNFDKVWDFNNPSYTDETTDAADIDAGDFTVFRTDAATAGDIFYAGEASQFSRLAFALSTKGVGVTLAAEYWNGSTWASLAITDGTSNLTADGDISFTAPADWATTAVNGSTQYYVRFKTTTNPTTAPLGTQVRIGGHPRVTVTTVANNAWLVDVLAFRSSGNGVPLAAVGAGQTQRWSGYTEGGGFAPNIRGKGSTEGPQSPAGAVTMDWRLNGLEDWAAGALSLTPAP